MTVLGILADTSHFRSGDDLYVLTRVAAQLDRLGSFFDEAIACAPLEAGSPPSNFEPYLRNRVRIRPLRAAGGASVLDKVRLAARAVAWVRPLRQTVRDSDFLHLRCPCNVALVALLAVPSSTPWYAMYAGSWVGYEGEPWSYRLQRWLLRRRRNGVVTAYAPSDAAHLGPVIPFYSPTHTRAELVEDAEAARAKVAALLAGQEPSPLRVVGVGHLTANKNHETAIRAVAHARERGCDVELDIAGDGELREDLQSLVDRLGVNGSVRLHGLVPRTDVRRLNRQAHVSLVLSRTEGYPKVALEGMAAGAVPLLSPFALAHDLTGGGARGKVATTVDPLTVAESLVAMQRRPAELGAMAEACLAYAGEHSLEAFQDDLGAIFARRWPALFGPLAAHSG
jgi:glycosyltransferase involved in cell wall biosynthesis